MTDNRTTEQTATERLRALLDERGVEYETACDWWTSWDTAGALSIGAVVYCEDLGSGLEIRWHIITPEQAIAATLGSGTCEQEERGWGTEGDHARVWLTCGHDCMVPTVADLPNYCPECGAKVVNA